MHIAHISIYNDVAHLFSGLCPDNRNSRERVGPREESLEIQGPENAVGTRRVGRIIVELYSLQLG